MDKQHEKSKSKLKTDQLKNVFYHASAPTAYSPLDFGVSEEQSNLIIDMRRQFEEGQIEALIARAEASDANRPTIANSVLKTYAAMGIRQEGNHLKSYLYLCQGLYLLDSLPPEEKQIEYCLRLRVNIGVQLAIVLKALSSDTYYPKMICKAAAALAPDGKLGNWTSYVTWAEYEINDDERAGVPEREINEKTHRILMELKRKHGPLLLQQEKNMDDYLRESIYFTEYRRSGLYEKLRKQQ